jgi:hypothetical protein
LFRCWRRKKERGKERNIVENERSSAEKGKVERREKERERFEVLQVGDYENKLLLL